MAGQPRLGSSIALVQRIRRHSSIGTLFRSYDDLTEYQRPSPNMAPRSGGASQRSAQEDASVVRATLLPGGSTLPTGLMIPSIGLASPVLRAPTIAPAVQRDVTIRPSSPIQTPEATSISHTPQVDAAPSKIPEAPSQIEESESDISNSDWNRLQAAKQGYQDRMAREKESPVYIQRAKENADQAAAQQAAEAEAKRRQDLARAGKLPKAQVVYLSPDKPAAMPAFATIPPDVKTTPEQLSEEPPVASDLVTDTLEQPSDALGQQTEDQMSEPIADESISDGLASEKSKEVASQEVMSTSPVPEIPTAEPYPSKSAADVQQTKSSSRAPSPETVGRAEQPQPTGKTEPSQPPEIVELSQVAEKATSAQLARKAESSQPSEEEKSPELAETPQVTETPQFTEYPQLTEEAEPPKMAESLETVAEATPSKTPDSPVAIQREPEAIQAVDEYHVASPGSEESAIDEPDEAFIQAQEAVSVDSGTMEAESLSGSDPDEIQLERETVSEPSSQIEADSNQKEEGGFTSRLMDAARSLFRRKEQTPVSTEVLRPQPSDAGLQRETTEQAQSESTAEKSVDDEHPSELAAAEIALEEPLASEDNYEISTADAITAEVEEPTAQLVDEPQDKIVMSKPEPEEQPVPTPLADSYKAPVQAKLVKDRTQEKPAEIRVKDDQAPVRETSTETDIKASPVPHQAGQTSPIGEPYLAEDSKSKGSYATEGEDIPVAQRETEPGRTTSEMSIKTETGSEQFSEDSPAVAAPDGETSGIEDVQEIATGDEQSTRDPVPMAERRDEEVGFESNLPLEQVWPVQRKEPIEVKTDSKADVGSNDAEEADDIGDLPTLIVQRDMEEDVSSESELRSALAKVSPGKPTDSSIELLPPRRPRPIITPRPAIVDKPFTPAHPAKPAQLSVDKSPPTKTTPDPQSRDRESGEMQKTPLQTVQSPVPDTVKTDIGELPSDLWGYLGETPPAPEIPQALASGPSVSTTTTAIQRSEAVSPVGPHLVETTHSTMPISLEEALPWIQRTESGEETGSGEDGVGQEQQEDEESASTGADIEQLARDILPIIKRKLAIEWERNRGRF